MHRLRGGAMKTHFGSDCLLHVVVACQYVRYNALATPLSVTHQDDANKVLLTYACQPDGGFLYEKENPPHLEDRLPTCMRCAVAP